MACWTFLPRRGPAARALTTSFCSMPNSSGEAARGVEEADGADVQFIGDDGGEAFQRVRAGCHHGEFLQRQADAQVGGFAERGSGGADLLHPVHGVNELRVGREEVRVRPVGQVHGTAAGQAAPDFLGDQGQQGR